MDNTEQIDYWNGQAGARWREEADALDHLLNPFADSVIAALPAGLSGNALDVGCGSGALSLKLARSYGGVRVTGVDVSAPMLGLARRRADDAGIKAEFIQHDASTYRAPVKHGALVSRFGVMFFADPVAAFRTLHENMESGAPLSFACWRPAAENEWVMAPMKAALQFMSAPPPTPEPRAPGPFAFAEADYVTGILKDAGWSGVDLRPWDGAIDMPGRTVSETADFSLGIGPLARVIAEQDIDRAAVKAALEADLSTKIGASGQVALSAAAWIVTARA